jgi:hypothetical protein
MSLPLREPLEAGVIEMGVEFANCFEVAGIESTFAESRHKRDAFSPSSSSDFS